MTAAEVFAYEKKENSVMIRRCFSYDSRVSIPEKLEGLPVAELAPYTFSAHMDEAELAAAEAKGQLFYGSREERLEKKPEELPPTLCGMRLSEAELPGTLKRIGKYAFYNCDHLRRLAFGSSLKDLGSGLFTGCHHMQELKVTMEKDEKSCLKEMLQEIPEELRVDYHSGGAYARLLFPEYFEEGIENTPARNLSSQIHGSGLFFRNCFQQNELQFSMYDKYFVQVRYLERPEIVLEFALLRLRYPLKLYASARQDYEEYVCGHLKEAAVRLLKTEKTAGLKWLLEQPEFKMTVTAEMLEELIGCAGREQCPEAAGFLMDLQRSLFRPRRKSFEL